MVLKVEKSMSTSHEDLENLQIIRDTMKRSHAVTSVSGVGVMAMGAVALLGAYLAPLLGNAEGRMYGWLMVAILGCCIGVVSIWYQSGGQGPVTRLRAGRRFGLSLAPPIVAGCVLTYVFLQIGYFDIMPGIWMLCYGAGIMTAGAFSIRLIPIMGMVFMLLGTIGLYLPSDWFQPVWQHLALVDFYLGAVFGGVHLLFGAIIALKLNS